KSDRASADAKLEQLYKEYIEAGERYNEVMGRPHTAKEQSEATKALAEAKQAYDQEASKP
ncbi:hypothetical protein, partial [Comamonas sp. NyZ500]|uniref:hypothetical protein n=1 Tax=Comamonas sp. NyZ500 TaxID=2795732 RepID=UPI001ED8E615